MVTSNIPITMVNKNMHIELAPLRYFINDQMIAKRVSYGPIEEQYERFKRAALSLRIVPFCPDNDQDISYFNRYDCQSKEALTNHIPEFFRHLDEFYDLEEEINVRKELIRGDDFEFFFVVKLLHLRYDHFPIGDFLTFQVYDSFYGDRTSLVNFLYYLIEKDSNCRHFPELYKEIHDWIGIDSLDISDIGSSLIEPRPLQQERKITDPNKKWLDEIASRRGKLLKCKWNMGEIVNYFSFLYLETSENGQPYLSKGEFDQLFQDGFRIPLNQVSSPFKLNVGKDYPLKNITYAIYEFYKIAAYKNHDKQDYFHFFASYFEDYSLIMSSPIKYEVFSKNATKPKSAINKIDWSKYLPSGV